MKKILVSLAFVLLVAVPTSALAQESTRSCLITKDGIVINNKALDGAVGTLTFTVGPKQCHSWVSSFQWLVIDVDATIATAGNVLVTCTTGADVLTADKTPQTCAGSGTCTLMDAGIASKAVTTSAKWSFRLGIRGYRAWSCILSHDNTPTGADLVTVTAYLTD